MEHKTKLKWQRGMAFETTLDGHPLILDADQQTGGNDTGMRPKRLLLVALAGCSGMDVVSILKKMKVEYSDLDIEVTGQLTTEHPKYYESMHIRFHFTGEHLIPSKLEKAVSLSMEKYCGVSALFKKAIELTYEIVISEIGSTD